jgi:photosystem II stability/assembly factor-like uncharacterized protein
MKKILLLLAFIISTTSSLVSQYKFDEIIFDPRRMAFYDVAVRSVDNSVAVGQYGTIQLLSDSGKKSQFILMKEKKDLRSVVFATENDLVTVGDDGVIYISHDKGHNWELVESQTKNKLVSIIMIDSNIGFVVGAKGTILKTTDKGQSWEKLNSNTEFDLNEISYSGSKVLYAAGNNGTLLKSSDLGKTWLKIAMPSIVNLNHVKAIGQNKIYAMGDSLRVFISNDAGKSWAAPIIEPKPEQHFYRPRIPSYYFTDENNGILKVFYPYWSEDYDYITTNGGISWKREKTNSYDVEFPNEPICFDFANDNFGLMFDNRLTLFRIEFKNKRFKNNYISSLTSFAFNYIANYKDQFAVLSRGWGGDGIIDILSSNREFKSWNKFPKFDTIGVGNGYMAIKGMVMPENNIIILAANAARDSSWEEGGKSYYGSFYNGYILKSNDFGNSWKIINLPKNEPIYGISMYDNKYGLLYIGNTMNKYMITRDGGDSWNYFQLPDTSTNRAIYSIDCPSPYLHIITVDDNKYGLSLYKVFGEGKSWKKGIKLPATSRIAKYIDENLIYSFGSAGNDLAKSYLYIDKTTDEGTTWIPVLVDSSQRDNSVYDLVYKNANQFMIYTKSNFYLTNNGGTTWDKIPLNILNFRSDESFSSIIYYSKNELLCATRQGRMFRFLIDELLFVEIKPDPNNSSAPYPNPTENIVNIKIDENFYGGTWEISDINGKIYNSGKIEQNPEIQINLTYLADQVYLIRIINGNNTKIEKVIKK